MQYTVPKAWNGWSKCNCATVYVRFLAQISVNKSQTYTVASAPVVKDLVFKRRFRLCLGQCGYTYCPVSFIFYFCSVTILDSPSLLTFYSADRMLFYTCSICFFFCGLIFYLLVHLASSFSIEHLIVHTSLMSSCSLGLFSCCSSAWSIYFLFY